MRFLSWPFGGLAASSALSWGPASLGDRERPCQPHPFQPPQGRHRISYEPSELPDAHPGTSLPSPAHAPRLRNISFQALPGKRKQIPGDLPRPCHATKSFVNSSTLESMRWLVSLGRSRSPRRGLPGPPARRGQEAAALPG